MLKEVLTHGYYPGNSDCLGDYCGTGWFCWRTDSAAAYAVWYCGSHHIGFHRHLSGCRSLALAYHRRAVPEWCTANHFDHRSSDNSSSMERLCVSPCLWLLFSLRLSASSLLPSSLPQVLISAEDQGPLHSRLMRFEVLGEQESAEVGYALHFSLVKHIDDFFDNEPVRLTRGRG